VLKDIKDYYGTLELADPTLTATPEDNSQAIEYLAISKGYSCNAYRYLTIAQDNAIRHCRGAGHSIAAAAAAPEEARWTEVRLQTWMGAAIDDWEDDLRMELLAGDMELNDGTEWVPKHDEDDWDFEIMNWRGQG
jgi:hypothetical protein